MEHSKEAIVISGIGGYFPKSLNIEEFQKNLCENKDLLSSRWNEGEGGVTNKIGTIPTEYFDNSYFGIHRQQCTFLDPMHRLVLERTFEALVDAGINPNEVKGKNIGVYIGSSVGENDNLFMESIVSGYGVAGHSRAMLSNRVSYWLNLKGDIFRYVGGSTSFDCNWMSGMEVIRLAYEHIKSGLIESAIVGTANIGMNASVQWVYGEMNLLSTDGTTRAFDANAEGYGRSDGAVVFYLQKASEAKRIYASIVNVATMFNGHRDGNFLDYNVTDMVKFLENFYKTSPIKAEEVDFVEAYGCGIEEHDEKELKALDQIYCRNRTKPLLIGSVKSNTGHAEAAAAMFSIAKVLLAMEKGIIPANLNYDKPNPSIPSLVEGRMEVVNRNRKWSPKYAAVNALGVASSYGHILLKANPKIKKYKPDGIPRLVVASTRNEEGIKDILAQINAKYDDPEYFQLMQDLFAKPILGHLYRGYSLVGAKEPKIEFMYEQGIKRPIWFVYSGMGSQWNGMVSDLMKLPTFSASINKSHQILAGKGIDLLNIISTKDKSIFDNILNCFVGIAAIQIALTDILKSIGIVPDGIIGHSVGELGCAYADGCLTAEEMILAAYSRGRASIEARLIKGMMAAIGVGYQNIKDKLPSSIEVACHNSPESSTLSGPEDDMKKFVAELQAQGTFARLVNVANIAYHSRYIKPAAPILLKYLKMCLHGKVKRSSKWISTSNVEENWNTELAQYSSAEYHTNNLLSSVYFEEGLKYIQKDAILIEIAPHGLLQAILKRSLKRGCINIPLTQRGCTSGLEFLLTAIGKLYLGGLDMSLTNLYPKLEYPVSRGTYALAPITHWNHTDVWKTGLEDNWSSSNNISDFNVTINSEEFRECVGQQMNDKIIFPTSFYLNIVYQIMARLNSGLREIIFEDVHIRKFITIPKIGSIPLHAILYSGSGYFEITSTNDEIVVTGKMTFPQSTDKYMLKIPVLEITKNDTNLNGTEVYSEFLHRNQKYVGSFQAIKNVTFTEKGTSAVIEWNNRWALFLEGMIQQQLLRAGDKYQNIHLPKYIRKICINQNLLPNKKTNLKVNYEYSTKIIATDGLQIVDLKTTNAETEKKNSVVNFWEYVPLTNGIYSNIEIGIWVALQLLINNSRQKHSLNDVTITEIISQKSLTQRIRNVFNQNGLLDINIKIVNKPSEIVHGTNPHLVVYNDSFNESVLNIVLKSSNAFVLVQNNQQIEPNANVSIVAEFSCDNNNYLLLRKANLSDVLTLKINDDALQNTACPLWAAELQKTLQESAGKNYKRIYLISTRIPQKGFVQFAQELSSQIIHSSQLRFLFNLNGNNHIDYDTVHKQDLYLSIIKDNHQYAYLPFPMNYRDKFYTSPTTKNFVNSQVVLHYLGINFDSDNKELKIFDYSGINNFGQEIMGLAAFDERNSNLIPDPVLQWEVPPLTDLKQSVSLPFAYTAAYYLLLIKARLKAGEKVFIQNGYSLIGSTLIHVAAALGAIVYTTVESNLQREYLKRILGNILTDDQIFIWKDSSFPSFIMNESKGVGANVVIDCSTENLIQSTLNCISYGGRFIHIGHTVSKSYGTIGMKCFLKNISFCVVNLNEIIEENDEVKMKLKRLVQHDIDQKREQKLKSVIWDLQNVPDSMKIMSRQSDLVKPIIDYHHNFPENSLKIIRFNCNTNYSYFICGDNIEHWANLAEWLAYKGAKHIVISTNNKNIPSHIDRRLALLDTNFGCECVFLSSSIQSRQEVVEHVSKVDGYGPIHCVFLLPINNNNNDYMLNLDSVLRTVAPKALIVNLTNDASGVCQARIDAGFPTCNIQCDGNVDISEIISELNSILTYRMKDVFIKNNKISKELKENAHVLNKKLSQILPLSPKQLTYQFRDTPNEPKFIRLQTDNPFEIRELVPLFIIPGLNTRNEIEELGRNLLVPAFCAQFPSIFSSIQELADKYSELIRKIWPKNVYNLVGVSCGGVLATEIAKILDKKYKSTIYIYYIDGAPSTIQSVLNQLGESNDEMEINLLNKMFNNEIDNDKELQLLTENGWHEKNYEVEITKANFALLKQLLKQVKVYQPDGDLIRGTTHLIRPSDCNKYDNCELTQYYKQTSQVLLVEGDHLSIISNKDTAEYINETFQME